MRRLVWTLPVAGALILAVAMLASRNRAVPGLYPPRPSAPSREAEPSPAPLSKVRPDASPEIAPGPTGIRVLVRAQGVGLEGVPVEVSRVQVHESRSFKTPRGGRQELHGMPPGDYRVQVDHEPYIPVSIPVKVESGKLRDVVVDLAEAGQIYGRVADLSGTVLPDTQVALVNPETGGPGSGTPTTRTDASGNYRFTRVAPGRYRIRFRHPHHRSYQTEVAIHAEGEKKEVHAVLEPGQRISGRVLDESGAPVAGALVTASNGEYGAATTDSEGRFLIGGLADQPIYCLASAPGYGTVLRRDIAPGTDNLEILLPRGIRIAGRLEVSPLPRQFTLRLLHFDEETRGYYPKRTLMFGEDGEFALENLPPGTYKLEVEAAGYRVLDVPELTLRAGEKLEDVRIRLAKAP